jgi:O-antigen ligase
MWISVVCLIIFFVEFGFGWLLKLPIAVVKEGRLFSIGSLVERFALQMRGLDIATYFNFLGSGYNSYWWTCISNIPSYFSPIGNIKLTMLYENVLLGLKQSDPHNLYIAILVEGGLLSFVGFLVLLYRYGKTQVLNTLVYHSNKPNLHVEGGPFLLAMLSYYMVQVQPNYYFFPIFILRFYGYQKNTSR